MVKSKIINDPVHGFIKIPQGILLDLVDTSFFQRLRRIRQLALSFLVYPGAVHSRFNHCLGAMYLTNYALSVLRTKGVDINDEEYEATLIAILLHDVGHGPFSHALESVILQGLNHENMSRAIMNQLNTKFDGKLSMAIEIFEGHYHKKFLKQLVSGQLDMDRMDYLVRDSYFSGVREGLVSVDRIIETLDVRDNSLVVEEKGIYSVEKFIVARRLMYWQVYLHKAVLSAEVMMVCILKRARELFYKGKNIWINDALTYFFGQNQIVPTIDDETIYHYNQLDDEDILYGIKRWQEDPDPILSRLCRDLLNRKLLKVRYLSEKPDSAKLSRMKEILAKEIEIQDQEAEYFVFEGKISNLAYVQGSDEPICILRKDKKVLDLAEASDMSNISALSQEVTRYYIAAPANIWAKISADS